MPLSRGQPGPTTKFKATTSPDDGNLVGARLARSAHGRAPSCTRCSSRPGPDPTADRDFAPGFEYLPNLLARREVLDCGIGYSE